MWAIIHYEENGATSVVFHNKRACIFPSQEVAQRFESEILRPELEHLSAGRPKVKKGFFGKETVTYDYLPADQERKIDRILETMSIHPVNQIKFGPLK